MRFLYRVLDYLHASKRWEKVTFVVALVFICFSITFYLGYQALLTQLIRISQPQLFTASLVNDTSGWSTYKDSVYDINFQYPPDWRINVTAADTAYDCNQTGNIIKKLSACTSATHAQEVVVVPPNAQTTHEGIHLLLPPFSKQGTICKACQTKTVDLKIAGEDYTANFLVGDTAQAYSTYPIGSGILFSTGPNSMWSTVDFEFEASNKATFDTITKIANSIDVNH